MLFTALTLGYIFLIINLIYITYVGRVYKQLFYGIMLLILGLITSYLMIMVSYFTSSIGQIISVFQNLFLFTFAFGGVIYLVYVMWTMLYLLIKVTYDQVYVRFRKYYLKRMGK